MSLKKLLIMTAAGAATLGTTAAMAGGPDVMAAPAPVDSYFYVEANVGYAFQNYVNQASAAVGTVGVQILPLSGVQGDGASGGLVYGADFGYMFNQYIGLELGWTYLPRFANTFVSNVTAGATGLMGVSLRNAGAAWGALKLVAPLTENFDAFFKAGVSYKYGSLVFAGAEQTPPTGSVSGVDKMREWRPVMAAGVSYGFAEDWMASVSWTHFWGGSTYAISAPAVSTDVVTPASDVLMMSLGYKFSV
ncbi:MAG: outer membrane beta-barrel protein [Coxiellaceae bacterium]|nr:outer membrane beta-barrel protein [Coxiellaceae bacterium]